MSDIIKNAIIDAKIDALRRAIKALEEMIEGWEKLR